MSSLRSHRSRRRGRSRGAAQGRWAHVYSALDLGTNNCRLLVAKPARQGFRIVDSFSRIVRLGEGVRSAGRLSEAAMSRTIEALKICARKMDRHQVSRARNVATEACRRAKNGAEFLARVEAETGIRLDIIDSHEESRLALDGCASLLDFDNRHALVFDIGGGSTELIWLDLEDRTKPERLAWTSLDCGVVTLAERFGSGRIEPEVYASMLGHVREMLDPFEHEHRLSRVLATGSVQMLGTSGTVTTVAGVHLDLPRYDRSKVDGLWLTADEIDHAARRLALMDYAERAAHPCIGRGRADLVVAGCAILQAIMLTWPADRVRVADRGVREGLLRALVAEADAEMRAEAGPGAGAAITA